MSKRMDQLITEIIDIDSQYQDGYDMMISIAAGFKDDMDFDRAWEIYMLESGRHLWPRRALALTLFVFLTALLT